MMADQIERVLEPGKFVPKFLVRLPGWTWRFSRLKDARRFVNYGGTCPQHDQTSTSKCTHCYGWRHAVLPPSVCGAYLGDNDGTCPQLTCIRTEGHEGPHDNVRGDDETSQRRGGAP